jgi:hypothetical protein
MAFILLAALWLLARASLAFSSMITPGNAKIVQMEPFAAEAGVLGDALVTAANQNGYYEESIVDLSASSDLDAECTYFQFELQLGAGIFFLATHGSARGIMITSTGNDDLSEAASYVLIDMWEMAGVPSADIYPARSSTGYYGGLY